MMEEEEVIKEVTRLLRLGKDRQAFSLWFNNIKFDCDHDWVLYIHHTDDRNGVWELRDKCRKCGEVRDDS